MAAAYDPDRRVVAAVFTSELLVLWATANQPGHALSLSLLSSLIFRSLLLGFPPH